MGVAPALGMPLHLGWALRSGTGGGPSRGRCHELSYWVMPNLVMACSSRGWGLRCNSIIKRFLTAKGQVTLMGRSLHTETYRRCCLVQKALALCHCWLEWLGSKWEGLLTQLIEAVAIAQHPSALLLPVASEHQSCGVGHITGLALCSLGRELTSSTDAQSPVRLGGRNQNQQE